MEKIAKKQWLALEKAANNGDAEALWECGYYFENGAANASGKVFLAPDRGEAIRCYLLAAELGNIAAMNSLSNLLSETEHADYPAAIAWAESAIKLGDSTAAYNLGLIYRDLAKPKRAIHYYQLAAKMGDDDAHLQIGLCHLLGHGTRIDHGSAQSSFQKVVEAPAITTSQRSREDAWYWLALLNLMGAGPRRSVARARKMLERANADNDHESAGGILNVIGRSIASRPQL